MLEAKARWVMNEQADEQQVKELSAELSLDPMLVQLLYARGIHSKQAVNDYLNKDYSNFYDPFLLKGMRRAVDRIQNAIINGEMIRIYGDYDADGVSSTSLMIALLKQLQAKFDYYIPHRSKEGYGLNRQALDDAHIHKITLIITVDNGVSAIEEIKYASTLGIEVIVTDHHEPPQLLPEAYCIINPKQPDCSYPYKQLAGVGVAFKLAQAILGRVPDELLQYAAIGTVADLMPLTDENRQLVRQGLIRMRQNTLIGIRALAGIAGVEFRELTEMHIGYALAPRINASGRLEHARDAVELLTSDNEQQAEHLAHHLDLLNKERQNIVEEITLQALQQVEKDRTLSEKYIIIAANEDWHIGVLGIVASKLLDKYYRPSIVLQIDPVTHLAKGSARSIHGFDMYKALTECSDLLIHFGGHQAAAGMTLHCDQLSEFKERLNHLASTWLNSEDLKPLLIADKKSNIVDFSIQNIEKMEAMAPFGQGNPAPKFILSKLHIKEIKTMGSSHQHIKLIISEMINGVDHTMEAIGFGKGQLAKFISPSSPIDLFGEVTINEWNGVQKPQLRIQDMRIMELQVFDWRGGKRMDWSKVSPDTAVLLSSNEEWMTLPEEVKNAKCSFLTVSNLNQLEVLHQEENTVNLTEISDLLLYSLPKHIKYFKVALEKCTSVQRVYALFRSHSNSSGTLPSRDSFKKMYAALMQLKRWEARDQQVLQGLNKKTGMSLEMIHFILNIFEELAFVERTGTSYRCVTSPEKRKLDSSELYKERLQGMEVDQILTYSTTEELVQWIKNQLTEE